MNDYKKQLLISSIPLLLTLLFLLNIVMPAFDNFMKTQEQIKQEKTEIKDIKQKLITLNENKKIEKQVDKLKEELYFYDLEVPEKQDLAVLLADLELFAQKYKFRVVALELQGSKMLEIKKPEKDLKSNTSTTKKKKKRKISKKNQEQQKELLEVKEIPLTLTVVGHFKNLLPLVDSFEKYQTKMVIDSIEMKDFKKDEGVQNPRVEAVISFNVYEHTINDESLIKEAVVNE